MEQAILLISDLHAHYRVINEQLAHAENVLGQPVERVLVLGDFGLFAPNLHKYFRRGGARFHRPVSFIEGNHEDFFALDDLVQTYADVVTHVPRSSVQHYGDHRWLCIGGARYMDAWSTPRGSVISDGDIAACLRNGPGSIDIVISHDCPTGIGVASQEHMTHLGPPGDPGLARVHQTLQPRWWFFGHHHRWHERESDGTRFVGLPQSWRGYVLLRGLESVQRVDNEVALSTGLGWLRWLGWK
jgi:predicted phosphodiesterase